MGLMHKWFGPKQYTLGAPATGKVVPVSQVPDETFSTEMLGKGVAILPEGDRIVAPCDATVDLMFETGHAVSLKTEFGADILIHVGLETVNLKGKYYTVHAKTGDTVKAGQLLIEFDREAVAAEGYNTITPVVICNSDSFSKIETQTDKNAAEGETVITMEK